MRRPRRFRIQITKTGYLFLALDLGIGIAGLNTGNNLLYLIFSMMLSFVVLSGILSNNALSGLLFTPQFPNRIFAEEKIPVELTLKNEKKWFPSFSLSFSVNKEGSAVSSRAYILKILPGETESTIDLVSFKKRGRARLPDYEAETFYPFGLIRKMTSLPTRGETIVYPKRIPIHQLHSFEQKWLGDFLSGHSGGHANPYGIRNYVEGDPAKYIHWKSSMRSETLKVKEFEQEKKLKIHIELDLAPTHETSEDLREKAISLAASLLLDLIERQFEVSLTIDGTPVEPYGRGYIDAYLCALALAKPRVQKKGLPQFLENTILVTDREHSTPPAAWKLGPKELKSL